MPSRTVRNLSPEALKQFHPFKMTQSLGISSAIRQESAKDTACALAKALKERFYASKVMLFGSVARADFGQWSDIDLAVWGVSASDYYKAVAFASGYSSVFKVDLVDAEDCSQSLLQHITDNGIEI
ncbi:MAG TPA: nucleotidyltransferase domain-containing protein [Desulfuromonadales bacterium]|nr:nucleotidyltransferase domain-containing protein [Desulfuromonadales bacterium]